MADALILAYPSFLPDRIDVQELYRYVAVASSIESITMMNS